MKKTIIIKTAALALAVACGVLFSAGCGTASAEAGANPAAVSAAVSSVNSASRSLVNAEELFSDRPDLLEKLSLRRYSSYGKIKLYLLEKKTEESE